MSIDWNVCSKEIDERLKSTKKEFIENVFDDVIEYIEDQIYFSMDRFIPIIDLHENYFTLRLSNDCAFDKSDKRNILFNLEEEISDYDGGNLERLDRIKEIFTNCISLIEEKTIELENEWGR